MVQLNYAIHGGNLRNVGLEVQGRQIKLTTSVGVNSRQGQADTLAQLIRDADQALYRAKSLGRNQAVVAVHLQC